MIAKRRKSSLLWKLPLGAALLPLTLVPTAHAAQSDEQSTDVVSEIIVTAEKRDANLQSVPIAISAFSGEDFADRGAVTTMDIQQLTPGVVFSTNVVMGQPYIRGIGSDQLNIGSDPSVAMYQDGVYLSRPISSLQELYDVERVEVLKGPQAILYGRNATGGAINLISKAPTEELSGDASLSYGNYNAMKLASTLSGALVEDVVSARLSTMVSKRRGYMNNLETGGRLDNYRNAAARLLVVVHPSDRFNLRVVVDGARERDTRGTAAKVIFPGPATLLFGAEIPDGPRNVRIDEPVYTHVGSFGTAITANYDFGGATATSISAYRRSKFDLGIDLDMTEIPFANIIPEIESSKTYTQELRLASAEGSDFEWLIGGLYLRENSSSVFNIQIPVLSTVQLTTGETKTDSYAVFAQAGYDLTPELHLSGGLRYTTEKKRVDVRASTNDVPDGRQNLSETYRSLNPRVELDYTVSPGLMFYVSATKGFKSGGFNATTITNPPFDPETVWAFEAGSKGTYFDGKLRLNTSAFYYDYSDLQVNKSVPGQVDTIANAASARIYGIEAEGQAKPLRGVTLDFGLGWLHARYVDFLNQDGNNPGSGVQDLRGNSLTRAPDFTASLGLEYAIDKDWGELSFRADYKYTSKIFFDEFNSAATTQNGYGLLNARVKYQDPDGSWDVSLWANNLTNKLYSGSFFNNAGFFGTLAFWGAPRTYGVTAQFHM